MTSVLQRQLVGDYYDVFKNYYYENKAAGTEGIVKQIHQYSKYYTEWNTASDKGTRIQRALFKVRKTGQFKITPAILKLLSDRNDGSSLMTMLLKFLQLWNRIGCVELYVHCQLILLDQSVFLC